MKQQLTIKEAFTKQIITIDSNSIEAGKETRIELSTGLFDNNGNEIYEDDFLTDDSGVVFRVKFLHGAFWAVSVNQNDKKSIPLFLMELNGIIPATITKMENDCI